MARATCSISEQQAITCHQFQGQRRHKARLEAFENMKRELVHFMGQQIEHQVKMHITAALSDMDDSALAERVAAKIESMRIHRADCQ